MMRKRSSSQYEQVKHICRDKEYLPLHKFQALELSDAINLVKNYLPTKLTIFPFTEGADFEFKVDGMAKIMQNMPKQIVTYSFNTRYLIALEENDLIALIKAIPECINCVMLNYLDEFDEFPAQDSSNQRALHPDLEPPIAKSLKMIINTFNQYLRAGVEMSYDFKKYGLENDDSGLKRALNMSGLFGRRSSQEEVIGEVERRMLGK